MNCSHGNRKTQSKPISQPGQIREALLAGGLTTEELLKVAQDALSATKTFLSNGKVHEVPDYPVRQRYLEFVVHTIEGMPVKRQEHISKKETATSSEAIEVTLRRSPALRKAMRRALDRAETEAEAEE